MTTLRKFRESSSSAVEKSESDLKSPLQGGRDCYKEAVSEVFMKIAFALMLFALPAFASFSDIQIGRVQSFGFSFGQERLYGFIAPLGSTSQSDLLYFIKGTQDPKEYKKLKAGTCVSYVVFYNENTGKTTAEKIKVLPEENCAE